MRANRLGAVAGTYSMATKASASGEDAADWVSHVANVLPEGDATVTTSVIGDGLAVTVILKWTDGQAAKSLVTQTTL
jgi:hypothetical protein